MEFLGLLVLIYMVIKWESILALPAFIGGIILLIKIRKIRKEKQKEKLEKRAEFDRQNEQEIREKVQKGEIIYKDVFLNNDNNYIGSAKYVTTVDELKELLNNLGKYAEGYLNTNKYGVVDAFNLTFFSCEKYIADAHTFKLNCPIFSSDSDMDNKMSREVKWMKKVSKKDFSALTKDDITHAFYWTKERWIGPFITDVTHKKIYSIYITNPKNIKRSLLQLDKINSLNQNLETYTDLFGNEIIFKDLD